MKIKWLREKYRGFKRQQIRRKVEKCKHQMKIGENQNIRSIYCVKCGNIREIYIKISEVV